MDLRRVESVPEAFADLLAALRPRGVALSGGATAEECYVAVARRGDDWSGTAFWFGDERWVPVSDPESNEGAARRIWLDGTPTGTIHSLVDAAGPGVGDIEAAARAYDAALRSAPRLDVVHLGLGPDGHTASLFPGSESLTVSDRWVVPTADDLHPLPRLTFTYPAIAAARTVVVTVAGASKQSALARVRAADDSLPGTRVRAESVIWLADAAAVGDG